MISDLEFTNEMNRLAAKFPQVLNKEALRRTYVYVKSIPSSGLHDIVNVFIDSFRQTPLPIDFEKAVSDWRRQYFLKTGIYFGESLEVQSLEPECGNCKDLGIVKAKEDTIHFFRCVCERGKRETSKVPVYQGELRRAYDTEPCPIHWFKPKGYVPGLPLEVNEVWKRVEEWKGFLAKSEEQWKVEGYEYEQSKDRWGYKDF